MKASAGNAWGTIKTDTILSLEGFNPCLISQKNYGIARGEHFLPAMSENHNDAQFEESISKATKCRAKRNDEVVSEPIFSGMVL